MALGDTTELLEDIRDRGSIPSGDLRFTDAKLLKAATKEMREGCVPLLHAAKSEHLVTPYTVAVTPGTAVYRVPSKAIGGGGLRDVVWTGTGGQMVSLREIPVEELPMWGNNSGTPLGYYMRSYSVVLVPTPNVSGTLSMPYYARPSELVSAESATEILGISSSTPVDVTFSIFAGEPSFIVTGDVVDIVRGTPAFETLAEGLTVELADPDNGELTVLASSYDSSIQAGDWLCRAGTSPVVQLPVEMLGLLAVRTARRALKSAGEDRWQALQADVEELEARAVQWLSPRNDGEVPSVSPFSSGLFRGVLGSLV